MIRSGHDMIRSAAIMIRTSRFVIHPPFGKLGFPKGDSLNLEIYLVEWHLFLRFNRPVA